MNSQKKTIRMKTKLCTIFNGKKMVMNVIEMTKLSFERILEYEREAGGEAKKEISTAATLLF